MHWIIYNKLPAYWTDTNLENRSVRPGITWRDHLDLSEYGALDDITLLDTNTHYSSPLNFLRFLLV